MGGAVGEGGGVVGGGDAVSTTWVMGSGVGMIWVMGGAVHG